MKSTNQKNALFEVSLKFIIKNDAGKTLLLEMPKNSYMSGYYDLPGGRIRDCEKAEPFNNIISRELKEELGAQVRVTFNQVPVAIGRHVYPKPSLKKDGHIFWIFFAGKYLEGEINVSAEHKTYKWVTLRKNNIQKYFIRGPWEGMYHYLYKTFPEKLIK